jgi:hypothetical protein|tara:strand:+ start:898 stop:1494 length:597 start_codon:yes stop_codon:yes gene_type:complete
MYHLLIGHKIKVSLLVFGFAAGLSGVVLLLTQWAVEFSTPSLVNVATPICVVLSWLLALKLPSFGPYPSFRVALRAATSAQDLIIDKDAYSAVKQWEKRSQWFILGLTGVLAALAPVVHWLAPLAIAGVLTYLFARAKPLYMPVEQGIVTDTHWVKALGTKAEQEYGEAMSLVVDQDRPISYYEYVLLRNRLSSRYGR